MSQVVSKKKKLKEAVESSMYQYPFQNLSLIDMEGEVWKPFPEFGDYYMISNMGRIKALSRTMERNVYGLDVLTEIPEGIRIQDKSVKDRYLYFKSCVNCVKKFFRVTDLVYTAFVGDFNRNKFKIKFKDNDSLNNRADNLYIDYRRIEYRKADEKEAFKKQLWEKSGSGKKYPYQNLFLEDMEGEIWEPLFGFEKYYHISNLGRVKSLNRTMERTLAGKKVTYIIKEEMMHQRLDLRYKPQLSFSANVDVKRTTLNTDYAVYTTFVSKKKIDLHDYKIIHLDNDGMNVRPENLIVTTRKKK